MKANYFPPVSCRQLGSLFALILLGGGCSGTAPTPSATRVTRSEYHGWKDSITLANGTVETAIVPAIGRVMQFKFAGDADGPFFENRALDGKSPDPKANDWGNFGGDKTWPSPQADWPKITPRGWPPPVAFDSMPVEAVVELNAVTLTSAVDPHYGIRTQRHIRLEPGQPIMRIITTYEKVHGPPVRAGIWIITQFKDPQLVQVPIPPNTLFPIGYNKQSDKLPLDLKFQNGLLSLKRNPQGSYKVGTDGSSLLWLGGSVAVRIDSPRVAGVEYPDQGSSAEVYTNPDPLPYVELEMLGPLHNLKFGDRISQTNTYTLMKPDAAKLGTEARKTPSK